MSRPVLGPALAVVLAAVTLAIVAALVPVTPPRGELGDGDHYARMAESPLDAVAEAPYAERIGVPLVVAALPFGTETGFLVVAIGSLLAAAALVALVAGELGVEAAGQAAAGTLTAASYVGVHGLLNPYYVDPATVALTAFALLLALRGRWWWFAAALAVGVIVKEAIATLIVVPALLERRLSLRTVGFVLPALGLFVAVHLLAPALESRGDDQRLAFVEMGVLSRGFATSVANPIVALFGTALLLWPLGVLRGPPQLRRLHVWALLALPILAFGHMERTLGVFLPLALPAAFLFLRGAPTAVIAAFAAGSWWVTAIAGALTIGEGESPIAEKALLIAPGVALSLAALAGQRWWYASSVRSTIRATEN
jgi:hypothetical protein